ITSKVVLIMGRFAPERKPMLDSVREQLRNRSYLPVLFDFRKANCRNLKQAASTLAHIARFVFADITAVRSTSVELMKVVPAFRTVPVQPLLSASDRDGAFDFRAFPWVLETFIYDNGNTHAASLAELVDRVEMKTNERLVKRTVTRRHASGRERTVIG